jgi:hypothetical protein
VTIEVVRPESSEAELEAVDSVRAGIGGSLSMLRNIGGMSCSRAEGVGCPPIAGFLGT